MTNYERRMELLNQTKGMRAHSFDVRENDRYGRYNRCEKLDRETRQPKSTLGMRIMICVVIFVCYVLLDYGDISVKNVNTTTVLQQIGKNVQLGDFSILY